MKYREPKRISRRPQSVSKQRRSLTILLFSIIFAPIANLLCLTRSLVSFSPTHFLSRGNLPTISGSRRNGQALEPPPFRSFPDFLSTILWNFAEVCGDQARNRLGRLHKPATKQASEKLFTVGDYPRLRPAISYQCQEQRTKTHQSKSHCDGIS